jgi:hypothetical protein
LIYPVTFTDAPNGKWVAYKGAMAVTLEIERNPVGCLRDSVGPDYLNREHARLGARTRVLLQ